MLARELRQKYLQFFESKGALRLPSDSLVTDDPTLLFTVAGMVPFKAYFEERATPPRNRLTTSQKCLRTNDIDDIGDTSHCTFFEMLGNFAFGDYFKVEAVTWAWEFLTEVLKLNPKDLRVTIFQDDDEAFRLWHEVCGLPAERISRLGEKTNYWPSNAIKTKSQGPCGPCSEIFFDTKPDEPFNADWDGEGSRWLEIWNLVFTQFTGQGEGDAYQLIPLPKKNIDTGMGLDRTAAAINRLQGPFETDLLRPVIADLEKLSGKTYTSTPDSPVDIAFRRIADHTRATTFLIADGVTPDRTGRGYVLRRLMRRAIVAGIRTLGFTDEPFLDRSVPTVVEVMKDAYPELADRLDYILGQVRAEETQFRNTLKRGLSLLDEALERGSLSGEEAFDLYQENGLPFEVTQEVAGERGIDVDRESYETAKTKHELASGKGNKATWVTGDEDLKELLRSLPLTQFVGYTETTAPARILGLIAEGKPVQTATEGQVVDILLDETPFYAEAGGQIGDSGTLRGTTFVVSVTDTKKQNGLYFHRATVSDGTVSVGDGVTATVTESRRADIQRNHTATHLLHEALRHELGPHVQQRGSLVAPDRLRFDFAHGQSLTPEQIKEVESRVNEAILAGLPVEIKELPIDEARNLGAMMLFGEKYGDVVRVVSVGGDYSREFCGGTHVQNASNIGLFRLVSEGSAAAGVRRIEAFTGRGAETFDKANAETLKQVAQLLGVKPDATPDAVEKLQSELKSLRAELAKQRQAQAGNQAASLVESAKNIGTVKAIIAQAEGITDGQALSGLADDVLNRIGSGVVLLAANADGKALFVVKASKDAVAAGAHAGNLVKAAATTAGGGGGGRPDFAQAGGKDATKIADALAAAEAMLAGAVG